MLKRIGFKNFKSFEEAYLQLSNITVLIGSNASGKSNVRDGFKFLKGLSLSIDLLEIVNSKHGADGAIWQGIRGGLNEIAFKGSEEFSILCNVHVSDRKGFDEVNLSLNYKIDYENYDIEQHEQTVGLDIDEYSANVNIDTLVKRSMPYGMTFYRQSIDEMIDAVENSDNAELFDDRLEYQAKSYAFVSYFACLKEFDKIKLIDFDPNLMRMPSRVTQNFLDERGGNLSSVLRHIYQDENKKDILIRWLEELTKIEIQSLSFDLDRSGLVTLIINDSSGSAISAYSASDGTLRFLGILASLISAEEGSILFFEEIDNGIHPSKVRLLVEMINTFCDSEKTRVIFTTHSPEILNWLPNSEKVSLNVIYRSPDSGSSKIINVDSIEDYKLVSEKFKLGDLHEMGWFEDAIFQGEE